MRGLRTILTAAQTGNATQSMGNTLDIMMLAMLVGIGVYFIYTIFRLKREGILFENKVLYPSGCAPENCTDPEGFIRYISAHALIFGIVLVLSGVLYALCRWIPAFSNSVTEILKLILPVVLLIWYMFICRSAAKRFW